MLVQPAFAHTCPPAHVVPHAPQFCGSVEVSTHRPLQLVSPVGHVAPQTLLPHTWPGAQVMPHAPQLCGSRTVSTHVPEQTSWPAGHAHAPLVQAWV
jgi:hypothetical protein